MMSRNDFSWRARALLAACVVVGAASIPGVALALQQQVVGGHALDANLQVDGSGFNTARASNRVGGLQSNAYAARREFGGGGGLSTQMYRPTSYGRQYGGGGGGYTLDTGYGTYSRSAGRSDPLRVSQASALQVGTYIEQGVIPGGGRSAASPRGLTTPKPTYNNYRLSGSGRMPSTGLSSTRYTVSRRR